MKSTLSLAPRRAAVAAAGALCTIAAAASLAFAGPALAAPTASPIDALQVLADQGVDVAGAQPAGAQVASSGETAGEAMESAESGDYDLLFSVYSNPVQGYALLVDSGIFTTTEYNGGEGMTVFSTGDPEDYGRFSVFYVRDPNAMPSVEEYFEEMVFHAQMEYGDTLQMVTEGTYEQLDVVGVQMSGIVYLYQDSATGQIIENVKLIEERTDGRVYYSAVYTQDDYVDTIDGMMAAVSTFKPDADAFGATVVWTDMASVVERPYDPAVVPAGSPQAAFATGAPAAPAAQQPATQQPVQQPVAQQPTTPQEAPYDLELVSYDGGFFSITLPAGWNFVTSGAYDSFSIEAFDPANPAIRLVYWGMVPFNATQTTRDMFQLYAGTNSVSAYYAALPVLTDWTMASAIGMLDQITDAGLALGADPNGDYLMIDSVAVTSSQPVTYMSMVPGASQFVADEAVVSAGLVLLDGTPCRADFMGSLTVVGAGDIATAAASGVWGIVAPDDIYDQVAAALAPCVGTLQFSDEYVREANAAGEQILNASLQYSADMNALSSARNEAFCDYILDRDRFTFSDGSQLVVWY